MKTSTSYEANAADQAASDAVLAKEAEVQRFSWFDALFSTIKTDLKNGNKLKAQKLADLGQYLAQDLAYYSQVDLAEMLDDQEGSL